MRTCICMWYMIIRTENRREEKLKERKVEHVTVLKTTTPMRDERERDSAQCIWAYDFRVVVLEQKKKEKAKEVRQETKRKRVDQRTLVLASLSKNKYVYIVIRNNKQKSKRRKWKKEEGYTYSPGNAMSLPRKREEEEGEEKTLWTNEWTSELTTMLLMNDHYRPMANWDDRNYRQLLHVH